MSITLPRPTTLKEALLQIEFLQNAAKGHQIECRATERRLRERVEVLRAEVKSLRAVIGGSEAVPSGDPSVPSAPSVPSGSAPSGVSSASDPGASEAKKATISDSSASTSTTPSAASASRRRPTPSNSGAPGLSLDEIRALQGLPEKRHSGPKTGPPQNPATIKTSSEFKCEEVNCQLADKAFASASSLLTHQHEFHLRQVRVSFKDGSIKDIPRLSNGLLTCPCKIFTTHQSSAFRTHAHQCSGKQKSMKPQISIPTSSANMQQLRQPAISDTCLHPTSSSPRSTSAPSPPQRSLSSASSAPSPSRSSPLTTHPMPSQPKEPSPPQPKRSFSSTSSNSPLSHSESPDPVVQIVRSCIQCGTRETPAWRSGPAGSDLCNACGVRWKRSLIHENKDARQQHSPLLEADDKSPTISSNSEQPPSKPTIPTPSALPPASSPSSSSPNAISTVPLSCPVSSCPGHTKFYKNEFALKKHQTDVHDTYIPVKHKLNDETYIIESRRRADTRLYCLCNDSFAGAISLRRHAQICTFDDWTAGPRTPWPEVLLHAGYRVPPADLARYIDPGGSFMMTVRRFFQFHDIVPILCLSMLVGTGKREYVLGVPTDRGSEFVEFLDESGMLSGMEQVEAVVEDGKGKESDMSVVVEKSGAVDGGQDVFEYDETEEYLVDEEPDEEQEEEQEEVMEEGDAGIVIEDTLDSEDLMVDIMPDFENLPDATKGAVRIGVKMFLVEQFGGKEEEALRFERDGPTYLLPLNLEPMFREWAVREFKRCFPNSKINKKKRRVV
ncbi:hypothetical protein BCR33DRAFT_854766 [Rhizoclosmatium globosum]|uniref:GATA-type domain-containing protein n=1 Tax=Rhizoclosmatium globosum TaxID=329046 RepID=A0A1Y2BRV6_9FUNG|nr:hypothetical protein BCR33DRAFT_854766 [Rhizoclosmatium globosum]|eukprot:ORY37488.1 hypothetical protein BCR33DRAFT_854766 [Rhizoclosmatium globosum]